MLLSIGNDDEVNEMTNRSSRHNPLIARMEEGKAAIGVWTAAYSASRIAKIIATCGADFIVADVEHDVLDQRDLQRFLLQVGDYSRRFGNVRTPAVIIKLAHRAGWGPQYEIAQSLKLGPAMGVWIPFVESRKDLEEAISAVRNCEGFAHAGMNIPLERRDVWPLNPDGEYFVVAMIKSQEGVRKAEEIISTPGLAALEVVHMPDDDTRRIVKLCQDYGVVAAVTASPEAVAQRLDEGYRLISIGWDYAILADQLKVQIEKNRQMVGLNT